MGKFINVSKKPLLLSPEKITFTNDDGVVEKELYCFTDNFGYIYKKK
ncbi:hypothetical protein [Neobacillus cucumis]|nr:hypothetical protein [Neobacillus cucumis]